MFNRKFTQTVVLQKSSQLVLVLIFFLSAAPSFAARRAKLLENNGSESNVIVTEILFIDSMNPMNGTPGVPTGNGDGVSSIFVPLDRVTLIKSDGSSLKTRYFWHGQLRSGEATATGSVRFSIGAQDRELSWEDIKEISFDDKSLNRSDSTETISAEITTFLGASFKVVGLEYERLSMSPQGMKRERSRALSLGGQNVSIENIQRVQMGQSGGLEATLLDGNTYQLPQEMALWRVESDQGIVSLMNGTFVKIEIARRPTVSTSPQSNTIKAGNAAAVLRNSALEYVEGKVVERDLEKAMRLLTQASQQGDGPAMRYLANALRTGTGIQHHPGEALYWYHKAALAGEGEAMYILADAYREIGRATGTFDEMAKLLRKSEWQMFVWYKRAAEANHQLGMIWLAQCYQFGAGCKQDMIAAMAWLEKAGAGSDPEIAKFAKASKGELTSFRPSPVEAPIPTNEFLLTGEALAVNASREVFVFVGGQPLRLYEGSYELKSGKIIYVSAHKITK